MDTTKHVAGAGRRGGACRRAVAPAHGAGGHGARSRPAADRRARHGAHPAGRRDGGAALHRPGAARSSRCAQAVRFLPRADAGTQARRAGADRIPQSSRRPIHHPLARHDRARGGRWSSALRRRPRRRIRLRLHGGEPRWHLPLSPASARPHRRPGLSRPRGAPDCARGAGARLGSAGAGA